jgi:hypothetical protein
VEHRIPSDRIGRAWPRRLRSRVSRVLPSHPPHVAAASGHASRGVTPQVGTSNAGGPITRDEILARAASWLTENDGGPVPYSQTAYWTDSNGTYREDCSGFVSMAWHLVSDSSNNWGDTTWTLPNVATAESFSALQPGDILDYTAEHTFLFAGWVDQAAGTFDYYAESNPKDPTHYSEANINDSQLEGWPTGDYTAYRYNNIFTPPPPTSAATFTDGTGRPAALHHADGRLEMLAVSPSGGVENKYETVADGAWSSWNGFGPTGADVVSVADGVHQDGRVEVFAVTSTGAVLNKYETAPEGAWAGWYGFGPSGTVTSLAVARHADGRLEVFAVMSDGSVENKYETAANGTWSDWNDFGLSGTVANIVVATHHDGRLEVLATLSDGSIDNKFETAPDASWSGWNGFAPAGTD